VKQGENGFIAKNPAEVDILSAGVTALLARRNDPGRAQAVCASVADCTLERNWTETLDVIRQAAEC
jgi:hypothetical protein